MPASSTAAAFSSPSSAAYASTVIPICQELLDKTYGDHELTVILRQLIHAGRAMTTHELYRRCCYHKTHNTFRKKLDQLSELGLIDSKKKYIRKDSEGRMIYANVYSAKKELLIDDAEWTKVAFIREEDMLMLGDEAKYILAEMLNKFHYMSSEQNISGIHLSCNDIINLVSANLSKERIRQYCNILNDLGHIDFIRRRRGAKFEIEFTDKLRSYELRKVIGKSAEELVRAFEAYKKAYFGIEATASNKRSWLATFTNILEENGGKRYRERKKEILGIIAYLCRAENKDIRLTITSPYYMLRKWNDLAASALKMSKRWVKKFILRLVGGKIKSAYTYTEPVGEDLSKVEIAPPEEKSEVSSLYKKPADEFKSEEEVIKAVKALSKEESEKIWCEVLEWEQAFNRKNFEFQYKKSRYGAEHVDFEDYMAQARLLMYQYLSCGESEERNTWLHGRLKNYMFENRCVDKRGSIIGDDGKKYNPILRVNIFVFDDFLDRLKIPEAEYIEPMLAPEIIKALSCLPARNKRIMEDYLGFEGRKYTYRDLSAKYKLAISTISEIINKSAAAIRTMLDPPKGGIPKS
jgi:hypothetical protein